MNVVPDDIAPAKPDVSALRYAAVIRAYALTPTLERVVAALRTQSVPPAQIIIVDSSSDPDISSGFAKLADQVVAYPREDFNYSKALNLGHEAHDLPFTLNISSHMIILDAQTIERGWKAGAARGIEVVFWVHTRADDPAIGEQLVRPERFSGRNGMSNAMAMIPTRLLRERPFREEVFSAEDQEWTNFYFKTYQRPMLCVVTTDVSYENPNHQEGTWSDAKVLNEELAIGYFINRRLLMPDRIIIRFLRGVLAAIRNRPERARMHLAFAWELTKANFMPPTVKSKYF